MTIKFHITEIELLGLLCTFSFILHQLILLLFPYGVSSFLFLLLPPDCTIKCPVGINIDINANINSHNPFNFICTNKQEICIFICKSFPCFEQRIAFVCKNPLTFSWLYYFKAKKYTVIFINYKQLCINHKSLGERSLLG